MNAGLMHKNIVMFKGVCTVAPEFAIVMEYVDDGTLFDHVKTTLEPTTLTSYARQVRCRAIAIGALTRAREPRAR